MNGSVRLPGDVYVELFKAFYGTAPPLTKGEVCLPIGEYRQMAWAYGGDGPTFTELNDGSWKAKIRHAKQKEEQPDDEESTRVAARETRDQWHPQTPTLRRMTPEEVAAMAADDVDPERS